MAAADQVIVDLGTGDGRAAVARARREPSVFVIGLDASPAAMAETSRHAVRAPRKGGLPNVLFAVAAAERPPAELCGLVDEVTVLFPWGSLLRGVLGVDRAAAAGIAGLLAPGGRIRALVSLTDRDGATADLRPLTESDRAALADRWAGLGMTLAAFDRATAEEIAASGSTWARRLGRERPVWRVDLCRSGRLDQRG